MNFKVINKVSLLMLTTLFIFSSCTKDGPVFTQEAGFKMFVNETEIESDAVAAVCQTDSSEFIIISNKVELLTFPMQTQDFEEGDFVYFKNLYGDSSWSYGGQALGEEVTGFAGLSILFSDAELRINENDGQTVNGAAFGTLYSFDSFPLEGVNIGAVYHINRSINVEATYQFNQIFVNEIFINYETRATRQSTFLLSVSYQL